MKDPSNAPVIRLENNEFLNAVYRHMLPKQHAIVCCFDTDPADAGGREWMGRPWRKDDEARWCPHYTSGFNNIYFTISSFRRENGERRRRKSAFVQMHAVMIDDIGTKVPFKRVSLEPTVTIETSPGNYQGIYLLKPAAANHDASYCDSVLDALVASGLSKDGADPGMKGVTRVARCPEGYNTKQKYYDRRGYPFRVQARKSSGKLYTLEELVDGFDLELNSKVEIRRAPPSGPVAMRRAQRFVQMLEFLEQLGLYGKPSGDMWHHITCPWIAQHTDRVDSGSYLMEPCEQNDWYGGFVCHHGHCRKRHLADVFEFCTRMREAAAR